MGWGMVLGEGHGFDPWSGKIQDPACCHKGLEQSNAQQINTFLKKKKRERELQRSISRAPPDLTG